MIVLILFLICSAQAFQCNFESDCSDFILDDNWGLTDGGHPLPINHDHTLNTSAGHYIYYSPTTSPQFEYSQIQFKDWIEPSTDRATCFTMWFYTTSPTLTFSILFVQGDDEKLWRTAAVVSMQNVTNNDWSLVNIDLPAERVKLFIRTSSSTGPLVFDDLNIDYCASPRPPMPKVLYACDFESSCSDNFISLPDYPYQWSVIQAGKPPETGDLPPSTDFTYGNESGHYAWVNAYLHKGTGRVGYFGTRQAFNIQPNQSYCLNFEYFQYGSSNVANLKVYTRLATSPDVVQAIWPLGNGSQYQYTNNRWTWSIINLPVGYYSLLFRIDTVNAPFPSSFVLDNIEIKLCEYPPTQPTTDDDSFLSLYCNFDDMSLCEMENGDTSLPTPSYNFIVANGDTVPKPSLGPIRDHTSNLTTGGFIYWNQALPFVPIATGIVRPNKTIEHSSGMCFQFSYYVKSLAINKNGTTIILSSNECVEGQLWNRSLDDSEGWQTVSIPVSNYACREKVYFMVNQQVPIDVSVAFDDIIIRQCSSPPPTSSTTTNSTPGTTSTDTTTTDTGTTSSPTAPITTTTDGSTFTTTTSNRSTITATVTSTITETMTPTVTSASTITVTVPPTTTTTATSAPTTHNSGLSQYTREISCLICTIAGWNFTRSMNNPRWGHTASVLANGKVLVAGGFNNFIAINNAELYDPSTGTWTTTGSMKYPRYYHTATILFDGKVLVSGGTFQNTAELYDPATGQWSITGNMNTIRVAHTANILINGKVLVAGGYSTGNRYLNSAELYDPSTGIWTNTGTLNNGRYYHSACVLINGKILVTGGYINGNFLTSTELYDPLTGLWTNTGNLLNGRYYHTTSTLLNGQVLVTGGFRLNYLNTTELYDLSTGTWIITGPMNYPRMSHTATVLTNGNVLVTGGYTTNGLLNRVELYNPLTGQWTITDNMNVPRYYHTTSILLDGRVLVAGGRTSLNSAELY